MWGPFRQILIEGHLFYVDQARKRLLSQFDDIESEGQDAAADWLDRNGPRFNPDRDDPEAFYEAAQEEGIAHYQLLSNMRDNTRLSVVAGMFHEWDKQLRDWMVREIQHWHRGPDVCARTWSQNFGGLADLFACLGWDIRSKSYYPIIDACRLVVNVYKHGEGDSFQELKRRFPEYVDNPLKSFDDRMDMDFTDHRNIKVTENQIQSFSDAIAEFWGDVPENIFDDMVGELPIWFEKAWMKDVKAVTNRSR
jgi:hypothetical protein